MNLIIKILKIKGHQVQNILLYKEIKEKARTKL